MRPGAYRRIARARAASSQKELQRFYYRSIHPNGCALLLRRTSQRVFDATGQITTVRTHAPRRARALRGGELRSALSMSAAAAGRRHRQQRLPAAAGGGGARPLILSTPPCGTSTVTVRIERASTYWVGLGRGALRCASGAARDAA